MNRLVLLTLLIHNYAVHGQFYFKAAYPQQQLFSLQYNSKEGGFTICYSTSNYDCAVDYTSDSFKTVTTLLGGKQSKFKSNYLKYFINENRLYASGGKGFVYYNLPYNSIDTPIQFIVWPDLQSYLIRNVPVISFGGNWFIRDSEPDSIFQLGPKAFLITSLGYEEYKSEDSATYELISRPQKINDDMLFFAAIPVDTNVDAYDTTRVFNIYEINHITKEVNKIAEFSNDFTSWLMNTLYITRNNLGEYFIASSMKPLVLHKLNVDFTASTVVFDSRWSYNGQAASSIIFDHYSTNTFFLTFPDSYEVLKTTDGFKTIYPIEVIPKPDKPLEFPRIEIHNEGLMSLISNSHIYLSTKRGGSPYTGITRTPAPKWQVYPNPVKASVTLNSGVTAPTCYQVYDMSGRVLLGFSGEFSYSTSLDLSPLASGLYLIRLSTEHERTTIKLMKE